MVITSPGSRATPDKGHTMLLFEVVKDTRTFRDYPDLETCLDGKYQFLSKNFFNIPAPVD